MLSWLYFLRVMVIFKRNIIIPCIGLSIVFHVMLFTIAFGIIKIKKEISHIEVFIFAENKVSKNSYVPAKKREISNKSERLIEVQKENFPNMAIESEVLNPLEFQRGNDRMTKNVDPSSEGGEKIIDSTFGSINGPKFLQREAPIYPQWRSHSLARGNIPALRSSRYGGDCPNLWHSQREHFVRHNLLEYL